MGTRRGQATSCLSLSCSRVRATATPSWGSRERERERDTRASDSPGIQEAKRERVREEEHTAGRHLHESPAVIADGGDRHTSRENTKEGRRESQWQCNHSRRRESGCGIIGARCMCIERNLRTGLCVGDREAGERGRCGSGKRPPAGRSGCVNPHTLCQLHAIASKRELIASPQVHTHPWLQQRERERSSHDACSCFTEREMERRKDER